LRFGGALADRRPLNPVIRVPLVVGKQAIRGKAGEVRESPGAARRPLSTVTRWLRGARGRDRDRDREPKTQAVDVAASRIDTVRAFAVRFGIDPDPECYALLYRHCILSEPGLDGAIGTLLETGAAPGPGSDEDDLAEIADRAIQQLRAVDAVVRASQEDAKGFGKALAKGIGRLDGSRASADAVARSSACANSS
jgi:hypothetical protein